MAPLDPTVKHQRRIRTGMGRALGSVALAAGVAVLAGCGSSRLSLPRNGFHSSTGQYSVQQVEAAFAAHGIRLHKASQQFPDVTALMSGHGRRAIYVAVETHATPGTYPIPIPVQNKTHHGNVTVVWLAHGTEVRASLHELH